MGDPFTGGNHEAWDKPRPLSRQEIDDSLDKVSERFATNFGKPLEIGGTVIQVWSNWCVACKGYTQEHTYDEHCHRTNPDHRMNTSDPDCEED